MKFDSSGGLIWHKTWSYLFDAGIAVDSSGNIYSAGETSSFGNGNYDVFLAKVNASGNMIWQKTWGGSFNDFVSDWTNGDREFGHGVGVDSSGNIYVTGATFSFGAGSSDVFLLKFNSTGALLFQKTWGGSGEDIGRDLAVDSSGNIYLTGDTASFGAGDWDVFLLKFNSAGNLQFQKTWGGAGRDGGSGVAVDSTGNVYVTGDTTSFGTGNQDAFLLKFDSTGGLSSQKTWGGSNADWGSDVDVDNLGNPVVTGYVSESSPYTLGSSGNVTLGIPTFILNNVAGNNLGTPVFPTYSAADFIASALGSESYVGGFDAFLLKYGALPMVTFQTNPSIGTIVFNGTIYMNGQNGNYTYGNATATASLLPGYIFTSWTTTGNIVAATPTSNSTTVIISGPGTLKANFTPLQTTPITPLTLIASVLSTSVLLILRRRRDR